LSIINNTYIVKKSIYYNINVVFIIYVLLFDQDTVLNSGGRTTVTVRNSVIREE